MGRCTIGFRSASLEFVLVHSSIEWKVAPLDSALAPLEFSFGVSFHWMERCTIGFRSASWESVLVQTSIEWDVAPSMFDRPRQNSFWCRLRLDGKLHHWCFAGPARIRFGASFD
jgi:hypothetical protein